MNLSSEINFLIFLKRNLWKVLLNLLMSLQKNEKFVYFQQLHQVFLFGILISKNEHNFRNLLKSILFRKYFMNILS